MKSLSEPLILQNFLDGKYVDHASGKFLDNHNPSNGKVYGNIPDSNKDDVDRAVQSALKGNSKINITLNHISVS